MTYAKREKIYRIHLTLALLCGIIGLSNNTKGKLNEERADRTCVH